MTKYLIFDFDGVLADSLEPIANAFKHSRRRYSFLPLETIKLGIKKLIEKPFHANSNKLSDAEKKEILLEIQSIGKILVQRNEVKFFEGFIQELRQLEDCKMAVVSSGSEIYLEYFCNLIDLPFDYIYGVETSLSKEDKIVKVCENWGIGLRDCWYFTDTLSDVLEIRDFVDNSKIIGCSWGFHGTKKLQTALEKDKVLVEFVDVRRILVE